MTTARQRTALATLQTCTAALALRELSAAERTRIATLQREALEILAAEPATIDHDEIDRLAALDNGPAWGRPGRIRRRMARPRPSLRSIQRRLQKNATNGVSVAFSEVQYSHEQTADRNSHS